MTFQKHFRSMLTLAVAAQLVGTLWAQEAPHSPTRASHGVEAGRTSNSQNLRKGYGFLAMLQQTVNLNAEQQDAVRGLLAEQREQMATLRDKTDGKIRAVLTPDQQRKFDAFLTAQKAERKNRKARA